MSMDLWYDLAVQELSDLDAHVAELFEDAKTGKSSADADADADAVEVVA